MSEQPLEEFWKRMIANGDKLPGLCNYYTQASASKFGRVTNTIDRGATIRGEATGT